MTLIAKIIDTQLTATTTGDVLAALNVRYAPIGQTAEQRAAEGVRIQGLIGTGWDFIRAVLAVTAQPQWETVVGRTIVVTHTAESPDLLRAADISHLGPLPTEPGEIHAVRLLDDVDLARLAGHLPPTSGQR